MIAPLFASLVAAGSAWAGGDPAALAGPPAAEVPGASTGEVPPGCRSYAAGGVSDVTMAWNQLLSFAGCVQDASVEPIADLAQLPALVDQRYDALAPAIVLYLEAIEHGPVPVQVRAAYAVGLANVALITRLRSSLVAPAERSDAAAWMRYRRLHAELEPMLVRALRTAWIAFAVIDRAAEEDPAIAPDPVTRRAVVAARAMLRVLSGAASERARPVPTMAGPDAI